MASSISSSNTSLPPSWLSESNSTSFRDASFSSYLNSAEETYIRSLVKTPQDLNYYHPRPKMVDDGEIDVFRADKYFNGVIDQETNTITTKHQRQASRSHTDKIITSLSRMKLQPRTPSIHLESSWNSQSALLRRVHRNPSRSNSNSTSSREKRSSSNFLSCYYCCDKKSVDTENQDQDDFSSNHGAYDDRGITRTIKTSFDTAEITRLNKIRLDSTNLFAYPVSTEPVTTVVNKTQAQAQTRTQSELSSMQLWDAIPRSVEDINTSGPPSEANYYKDTDSEASSDLFEIECLSYTPANPVMAKGPRRVSDDCATPTTAYAPSEASIDWSVVTASAADFSAVSDSEDQRSVLTSVTRSRMGPKPISSSVKMAANKGPQKTRSAGGILAGCKSQKAVRVAEDDVYRSPVKRKSQSQRVQRFSDSYNPVTRFQTEAKLSAGNGPRQSKNISRKSCDLLYI